MLKRTLLLVLMVLVAWPTAAQAHPAYKDSDPKANSSVASAPSQVWVEFTETIEDGTVSVFDPCGRQVDNGDSQQNLTNDRITVTMSANTAGAYKVNWSVLGSDSHPTSGSFSFTVSGGEPCPGQEEEHPADNPKGKPNNNTHNNTTHDSADEKPDSASSHHDGDVDGKDHRDAGKKRDARKPSDKVKAERQTKEDVVIADPTTPAGTKGIWDGIPMGDFMIALAVAALVGAAGGRIYAGIMGPR